ncbi:MAG: diguanylate cyclase [Gammaproteobacteria bacterium]|nr:diguanylate cyclase [Gammaproteobacteria bacterium]
MINRLFIFLLYLSFSEAAFASENDNAFARLKEIENLRTENVREFISTVNQLDYSTHSNQDFLYYQLYLKALSFSLQGQISESETLAEKVRNNTTSSEIKTKATLLLVNIYTISQNWLEGLLLINEAQEFLDQIVNEELNTYASGIKAGFYNQLGEYGLGYNNAERLLNSSSDLKVKCKAYSLMNEAGVELKDKEFFFEQAIETCSQANEELWVQFNSHLKGKKLLSDKQYKKASELLAPHLKVVESIGYPVLTAEFYNILAQSYFKQQSYAAAESLSKKTISLNKDKLPYKSVVSAYKTLYEIEKLRGNGEKSVELLEKYYEFERLNLDENKRKQIAIQTASHQLQEKNIQIELLNKKNEALTLEKILSKQEAKTKTLFIVLLGIIITFLIMWAYRTRKTHVRLRQLAEFDSLTGIANRRHFTAESESVLRACESRADAVSFILFDLDKFKNINDTFGHPVGDWVLQKIPEKIKNIIRKIDIFGRLGGEEFAILLPGCELDKAREIAEDIRKGLMEINTTETGKEFQITASFGLTVSRVSGYELDKLLKHSDDALYEAKRDGRNRVNIYALPPSEQYKNYHTDGNTPSSEA